MSPPRDMAAGGLVVVPESAGSLRPGEPIEPGWRDRP